MPDRPDRAVVERPVRRSRHRSGATRDAIGLRTSCRHGKPVGPTARSTVFGHTPRPWIHSGLSTWHPRKWRAIHPCRNMAGPCLCAVARRRPGMAGLRHHQSRTTDSGKSRSAALSARTLCAGRRRVRDRRTDGAGWLVVVHWRGGMGLAAGGAGDIGRKTEYPPAVVGPLPATGLGRCSYHWMGRTGGSPSSSRILTIAVTVSSGPPSTEMSARQSSSNFRVQARAARSLCGWVRQNPDLR